MSTFDQIEPIEQASIYELRTLQLARLKEAETAGRPVPGGELEQEITAAQRLASNDPKLDAFGKQLLEAVRLRAGAAGVTSAVTVKHQDRGADGWRFTSIRFVQEK